MRSVVHYCGLIHYYCQGGWRAFSEDELKEMEKYAAEMKVVKVTFNVWRNLGVSDAISTGLGRNKLLKQVTIEGVPEGKREFVKSKLSFIKTVTVSKTYSFVDL